MYAYIGVKIRVPHVRQRRDGEICTAMGLRPRLQSPEGPSTQYLRTLVPKAIKGMVFGTRVLKYWVLGPSGVCKVYHHRPDQPSDSRCSLPHRALGVASSALGRLGLLGSE